LVGAEAAAVAATSFIRITDSGQIFAGDGLRSIEQLPEWLRTEAKKVRQPVLMVIASREVRISLLTEITSAAGQAGFVQVMSAAVELRPARTDAK
jgi:biopolymer transport protein ExbD